MTEDILKQRALEYHRNPTPGKLSVVATTPLATQRDLALAYSPGVAAACDAIIDDAAEVATLTARQNLVGVISNGTAVLGLGNIGPLAAKPVMEGKAVLFKKFAGIDVFDIEIDASDPDRMVDIIRSLEPTFGAINLEDIKSPECFQVEKQCREKMNIPVFHDDQHGTAIVAGAAVLNGMRLMGKKPEDIKLVSTGGGAAGIACLNLLIGLGIKRENIFLVDHVGVVFKGRTKEMTAEKQAYAQDTDLRTLDDVIKGADMFLGLSAPGILTADMVKKMSAKPFILALANPTPEILPDVAKSAQPGAIIATGRSDFPNQVNNVLCFPFIFRGALDVGATTINEDMKLAAVHAIADLAMAESTDVVAKAYRGESLTFGPEYLIPKPFDPRLIMKVAPAVARAAMASGVASKPITDFEAYHDQLERFVFRSGVLMKPMIERARKNPKRVAFAEGESKRVLRAAQAIIDEKVAYPVLVGRPEVIKNRIEKLGLRIKPGVDFEITNPENDPRYDDYWRGYHALMERDGVAPDLARTIIRTNTTVIASMMLKRGEVDAMICGTYSNHAWHFRHVMDVIGRDEKFDGVYAFSTVITPKGTFFLCDTHVTENPSAEEIAEMTRLGAMAVKRFGEIPRVALISYSNFGNRPSDSSRKMREAVRILNKTDPELQVEGEMQADVALNEEARKRMFPNSRLKGSANFLVFSGLDTANAAFNLLRAAGDGLAVGPMLLGAKQPAHILTASVTARGIFNSTVIAVVDAQTR